MTGVRVEQCIRRHATIDADIVVDASGRHGASDAWLTAIGANPAEQESSPCGIFYTSRFYRLNDGADYPQLDGRKSTPGGVQGAISAISKVGLFRADNRTFSITLAADPEDKPMRAVAHEREFDIAVEHIEATTRGSIRRRRDADQQGLSLRQSEQRAQTLRARRRHRWR